MLVYGALAPQQPPVIVLFVAAAATPALAAFLGGSAVVAFAVDKPRAEDWGSVAACSAVGCLALGIGLGALTGFLSVQNTTSSEATLAITIGAASGATIGAAIGGAIGGGIAGGLVEEHEPARDQPRRRSWR
jgi:hypothetical protein